MQRDVETYRGRAFDLLFDSTWMLPELAAAQASEQSPDVRVHLAPVPLNLPGRLEESEPSAVVQGSPDALLLRIPDVAAYLVKADEIAVDPVPGSDDASIRAFLLGSAIAACLQLRELTCLHGSAVVLPDGTAALFCGVSTAGKSTLATALAQHGYTMLADDISAIRFDADGQPWCLPGLSRTKLWRQSLQQLGLEDAAEESRRVRPMLDKYVLDHALAPAPVRVSRVYELRVHDNSEPLQFSPVSGIQRMDLLMLHSFRMAFLVAMGLQPVHMKRLVALAPRLKMTRISRPQGVFTLPTIIQELERDWAV